MTCKRELGLFDHRKGRWRKNPVSDFLYLKAGYRGDEARGFSEMQSVRTRVMETSHYKGV